jgi:hypothetical protein
VNEISRDRDKFCSHRINHCDEWNIFVNVTESFRPLISQSIQYIANHNSNHHLSLSNRSNIAYHKSANTTPNIGSDQFIFVPKCYKSLGFCPALSSVSDRLPCIRLPSLLPVIALVYRFRRVRSDSPCRTLCCLVFSSCFSFFSVASTGGSHSFRFAFMLLLIAGT